MPAAPTEDSIQAILTNSCGGCHTNGGRSGGLNLDNFAASTISVSSTDNNLNLIEPGSRLTSQLYHKIAGTQGRREGSRMPLGRRPLSDEVIEDIGLYIDSLNP